MIPQRCRALQVHLLGLLLMFASSCHAEVYKWVDGNGQTHYSAQKSDAGRNKSTEVKVKVPEAVQESGADWRAQQQRMQDLKPKKQSAAVPPANQRPKSLSNGREDGTDASRCALARDVLSGAVRHTNGKPTDQYDRDVAENDVRTFCH